MKTHLFRLECLTDMHVGNGEANYNIIDNEVQKDTVLADVPIIHASGVKGALKEHFEQLWGENDAQIKNIFGDSEDAGRYKFFTAFCVARPLRVSSGDCPYVLAAGMDALRSFSALLEGLGLSSFYQYRELAFDNAFASNVPNIEIEGESAQKVDSDPSDPLQRLIGPEFAVAKTLRGYDLPVRARNALDDNGLSKNLWYEELVPHKSIFYFAVITPEDTCGLEFEKGRPVQFGGNASIGNGYASITKMDVAEVVLK